MSVIDEWSISFYDNKTFPTNEEKYIMCVLNDSEYYLDGELHHSDKSVVLGRLEDERLTLANECGSYYIEKNRFQEDVYKWGYIETYGV